MLRWSKGCKLLKFLMIIWENFNDIVCDWIRLFIIEMGSEGGPTKIAKNKNEF